MHRRSDRVTNKRSGRYDYELCSLRPVCTAGFEPFKRHFLAGIRGHEAIRTSHVVSELYIMYSHLAGLEAEPERTEVQSEVIRTCVSRPHSVIAVTVNDRTVVPNSGGVRIRPFRSAVQTEILRFFEHFKVLFANINKIRLTY